MLYVQTMVCRKNRTIWYVPLQKCVSRWNVYILHIHDFIIIIIIIIIWKVF